MKCRDVAFAGFVLTVSLCIMYIAQRHEKSLEDGRLQEKERQRLAYGEHIKLVDGLIRKEYGCFLEASNQVEVVSRKELSEMSATFAEAEKRFEIKFGKLRSMQDLLSEVYGDIAKVGSSIQLDMLSVTVNISQERVCLSFDQCKIKAPSMTIVFFAENGFIVGELLIPYGANRTFWNGGRRTVEYKCSFVNGIPLYYAIKQGNSVQ